MLLSLVLLLPLVSAAEPLDAPLAGEEIIPLGTDAYTPPPARGERMQIVDAGQAELLGQSKAGNRLAPVVVPFRPCGTSPYSVSAVRLRILTGAVQVQGLTLFYADNTKNVLTLRQTFAPNSDSDWITLPKTSAGRCPRMLVVNARNANLSPLPATIQVFGLVNPR